MRSMSKCLLAILVCAFPYLKSVAQDCPARPVSGTVAADPYNIVSQGGILSARFLLAHSVDSTGYTHYCYKYQTPTKTTAEAPTLRVNPGDIISLNVVDAITGTSDSTMKMDMGPSSTVCGDGGTATINSTNV